jgi:hypothetical protein
VGVLAADYVTVPVDSQKREPSESRKRVAGVLGFASAFVTLLVLQKAFHLTGDSFVGWIVPCIAVGGLVAFYVLNV